MKDREDRRRHPRVEHRLRVESSNVETLELETIDLSAGGLRCTAPAFIAPMTKMALSLVLPAAPGDKTFAPIKGEAVVVRTEKLPTGEGAAGACRVALFFSRMDDADRQRLQSFLKGRNGKDGQA
jgi:c-di-GMP-binding flagellar brake protein YcgR